MRRVLIGCLGVLLAVSGRAQTFAEWFQQNATRLEYYAQQVAAWEAYLGQLKKGYDICDAGLGVITGSKQGEYDLHSNYYASLVQVSPALGQMGVVAEIVALQAAIIDRFTVALARYRRDGLLGADQIAYIGEVYDNMLQAGLADVEALADVLTSGDLQMTDGERMERIGVLASAMRDRYAFTLTFTDKAAVMEGQLAAERAVVGTVASLYGL